MKLNLAINNCIGRAKMKAPEILLIAGTVSIIGGIITACKSSIKAMDYIADAKAELEAEDATFAREDLKEEYTEADYKKDRKNTIIRCGWHMIRLYAFPVILTTAGFFCNFKSVGILKARNAHLVCAYTSLAALFNKYRKNVRQTYGDKADFNMMHGVSKVEVTEVDSKGKTKTIKTEFADGKNSIYTRYICSDNPIFVDMEGDYDRLLWYKERMQETLNDRLRSRYQGENKLLGINEKIAFMSTNEIYDAFEIPPDRGSGLVTGVTYVPGRKGYDNEIILTLTPCKVKNRFGDIEDGFALDVNAEGCIFEQ